MARSNVTVHATALFDPRQIEEAQAASAITPGDLAELTSAGKVQRHSTAGGVQARYVATNNLADAGIKSDDYAADETARYIKALPGDVLDMFLADTVAATANTTYLVSNGDGSLKAVTTELGHEIVGVARETVTASGKTRCLVEIV